MHCESSYLLFQRYNYLNRWTQYASQVWSPYKWAKLRHLNWLVCIASALYDTFFWRQGAFFLLGSTPLRIRDSITLVVFYLHSVDWDQFFLSFFQKNPCMLLTREICTDTRTVSMQHVRSTGSSFQVNLCTHI